jgi:hypothetical protein
LIFATFSASISARSNRPSDGMYCRPTTDVPWPCSHSISAASVSAAPSARTSGVQRRQCRWRQELSAGSGSPLKLALRSSGSTASSRPPLQIVTRRKPRPSPNNSSAGSSIHGS